MSRLDDFLREEDGLFGPGWDLAVSLIAVLILALVIEAAARQTDLRREEQRKHQQQMETQAALECQTRLSEALARQEKDSRRAQQGQLEIQTILDSQLRLVDAMADHYGSQRRELGPSVYGISIPPESTVPDITISNEATLQRISFGSHALFRSDDIVLMPEGRSILQAFSIALRSELDHVLEIQIQGHADFRKPRSYRSNLELAAWRAMTVYQTLQSFGIDPTRTMMSASSFGEYVPVARRESGFVTYSREQLMQDNDGPGRQFLNRRIEVVLIYRQDAL